MGLLDWLTESIGSSTGQGEGGMGFLPSAVPPAPSSPPSAAPPMPPTPPAPPMVGPTGEAGDTSMSLLPPKLPAAPPVPDPSITDLGGGMQSGTMPQPLANKPPPTPPAVPPTTASAPVAPPPTTAPGTISPPPNPSSSSPGITALGRSIGLDPNTKREVLGSLGAGLNGVAANWNKPGLAAFAGGAGSAIEGGNKTHDKIIDDQHKALTDAVAAVQVGDKRALLKAQTEKALADAQATMQGRGSKDSVVNSDQQLYLRAVGATNQDGNLKLLKSQYDALLRGGALPDSDEAKAAKKAYQDAYDQTLNGHLTTLGLSPKKAAQIGKKPGMTEDNPIPHTQLKSQKDYDELPPGAWFVNPKDKRVLQKPLAPAPGAAAPAAATPPAAAGAAPPAAGAPPTPPVAPVRSATAPANDDDDEGEA